MRKRDFGLETDKKSGGNVQLNQVDTILSQVTGKVDRVDARYYLNQAYTSAYRTEHESEFDNELTFVEASVKEDISVGSPLERFMRSYTVNRIHEIFHITFHEYCCLTLEEMRVYERFAKNINESPEAKKAEAEIKQVQSQIHHSKLQNEDLGRRR